MTDVCSLEEICRSDAGRFRFGLCQLCMTETMQWRNTQEVDEHNLYFKFANYRLEEQFREIKLRLISADRWLAFWTMALICFLKRKSASTITPIDP